MSGNYYVTIERNNRKLAVTELDILEHLRAQRTNAENTPPLLPNEPRLNGQTPISENMQILRMKRCFAACCRIDMKIRNKIFDCIILVDVFRNKQKKCVPRVFCSADYVAFVIN